MRPMASGMRSGELAQLGRQAGPRQPARSYGEDQQERDGDGQRPASGERHAVMQEHGEPAQEDREQNPRKNDQEPEEA